MNESPALWVIAVMVVAGAVYFVLRLALQQSITTGIKLAADKQLEQLKSELTSQIEAMRHQYQLAQLQTSLLFEHKRTAFATLLARIAEVKREWYKSANEPYAGIIDKVPSDQYEKLLDTYYEYQLFLDNDCLAAIDLVLNALRDSFPWDDGSGTLHARDCEAAYNRLEFLQPRVAELFQAKLGVNVTGRAKEEIAFLGSILLLNHYHFPDIGLPVKGNLKLDNQDFPADAVAKAKSNKPELVDKLQAFSDYLRKGHGVFHEAGTDISRYIAMLEAD